jgi:hypothetical protein
MIEYSVFIIHIVNLNLKRIKYNFIDNEKIKFIFLITSLLNIVIFYLELNAQFV